MNHSVFVEARFWLLVFFSVIVPFAIYGGLLLRRAISRTTVLCFGLALVWIAGVDVYLLQLLAVKAQATPSLADDHVFVSELSMALYLLPLMFGGIGVNLISDVLVQHLRTAEARYDAQNPDH